MIRTSYFAGIKKFDLDISDCISISRNPPRGYKGKCLDVLAPSVELLCGMKNGYIGESAFNHKYLSEIEFAIDGNFDKLKRLIDGKVLLCYEKPEDFCHRHILAEWLREKLSMEVCEVSEKNS